MALMSSRRGLVAIVLMVIFCLATIGATARPLLRGQDSAVAMSTDSEPSRLLLSYNTAAKKAAAKKAAAKKPAAKKPVKKAAVRDVRTAPRLPCIGKK